MGNYNGNTLDPRILKAREVYRENSARLSRSWGKADIEEVNIYGGRLQGLREVFTQGELVPNSPKTDYFIHEFNKLLNKYNITIGLSHDNKFGVKLEIVSEGEFGHIQYADCLNKDKPLEHCIEQIYSSSNVKPIRDFDKEIKEFEEWQQKQNSDTETESRQK